MSHPTVAFYLPASVAAELQGRPFETHPVDAAQLQGIGLVPLVDVSPRLPTS